MLHIRRDLEPDVILLVLPNENPRTVKRRVFLDRRSARRVKNTRDPHAGVKVPFSHRGAGGRGHVTELGTQETRRSGDGERDPIGGPVQVEDAIAFGDDGLVQSSSPISCFCLR